MNIYDKPKKPKKIMLVKELIKGCNDHLKSPMLTQEEKRGVTIIAEWILYKTRNYKGYKNISKDLKQDYTREYL